MPGIWLLCILLLIMADTFVLNYCDCAQPWFSSPTSYFSSLNRLYRDYIHSCLARKRQIWSFVVIYSFPGMISVSAFFFNKQEASKMFVMIVTNHFYDCTYTWARIPCSLLLRHTNRNSISVSLDNHYSYVHHSWYSRPVCIQETIIKYTKITDLKWVLSLMLRTMSWLNLGPVMDRFRKEDKFFVSRTSPVSYLLIMS